MPSPTSDENSRTGRLEGQVVGIAVRVPHMQEELDRFRAKNGGADEGNKRHQERFSAYV